MRPIEIEAWVIRVLNRVVTKEPVEDSRVELKTVWPDEPWPTARRIGGNANAARGDPILWIIGADEKAGTIPGVHGRDLAGWYDPIRNLFDSVAPEPSDLIVQYGNATVVALVFDTSRSPYVVRNEGFGRVRGEPQKWEVPWRQLTSTRSATRHELLQLLVPALSKPDVEL